VHATPAGPNGSPLSFVCCKRSPCLCLHPAYMWIPGLLKVGTGRSRCNFTPCEQLTLLPSLNSDRFAA
jgi:hypothetical protein